MISLSGVNEILMKPYQYLSVDFVLMFSTIDLLLILAIFYQINIEIYNLYIVFDFTVSN